MKKRVIIIGAGFAGLRLARKLRNSSFELLLIFPSSNSRDFLPGYSGCFYI